MNFRKITLQGLAAAVCMISICSLTGIAFGQAGAPSTAPALTTIATPQPQPTAQLVADDSKWGVSQAQESAITTIGSLDPAGGFQMQLELVNDGAAIYTAKLANFYAKVADKKLAAKYKGDFAKYLQEVQAQPEKYHGNYSLLNPVPKGGMSAWQINRQYAAGKNPSFGGSLLLPYASSSLTIQRTGKIAVKWDLSEARWKALPATTTNPDVQSASFAWTLARQDDGGSFKPFLRLIKTYTLQKQSHSIELGYQVENLSGEPIKVSLGQHGAAGVPREDVRADMRKLAFGRLDNNNVQVKLDDINNKDMDNSPNLPIETGKPLLWIGNTNKFFASLMYLNPTQGKNLDAARLNAVYSARKVNEDAHSRVYISTVTLADMNLPPAGREQFSFNIFTGPKQSGLFDQNELYKQLNFMGMIELSGGCFCSFGWLSLAIMSLLEFLAKWVSFGNYGVAIIILVFVVRLILHPLTKKGQVSMMKMQKLGPKMAELKEKYKDDKDTLQRETMKFYKEQGTTPLLGCLPMLLQMPIWIALYTGLNVEVALRQAAFLPVWITDLAGQDAIVSWVNTPIHIPLLDGMIGPIVSFNLLPILLTIAMYYQTKLTPTSMGAASSPQQAQQQKMMKIMMPVMMLLFFYNAPAGLTLYIMASTASSVVEQMVIRKHIREREALAAATETRVFMPGKGPRDSRPKKPKGPFWNKNG